MNESDSPLEKKARSVRLRWFDSLPEKHRDQVIKPAFDAEHPTNADKKKATRKFTQDERCNESSPDGQKNT